MANDYTSAMAYMLEQYAPIAANEARVAPYIKNFGAVRAKYVDVPQVGAISLSTTDTTTFKDVTDTKATITVNQIYRYPIRVRDTEQGLSPLQIAEAHIPAGLKQLWNQVDASIMALYTDVTTSEVGTYGVALTSDTVADARAKLLANSATPETLVVAPANEAALCKDDDVSKIWAITRGIAAPVNGGLPQIHGMNVVVSNQVVLPTTNQYASLAFEKGAFAIAFADTTSIQDIPGRTVAIYQEPSSGCTVRLVVTADTDGMGGLYVLEVVYGVITIDETKACLIKC